MPDFAAYLIDKRLKLGIIANKPLTQAAMAEYLSPELSRRLGRPVTIERRAYWKWENGKTVPPYENVIREILGN